MAVCKGNDFAAFCSCKDIVAVGEGTGDLFLFKHSILLDILMVVDQAVDALVGSYPQVAAIAFDDTFGA